MIYWRYLLSLLRHKWYIIRAGRLLRVPFWRLLVHDWSKFTRAEFGPYARDKRGHFAGVMPKDSDEFQRAWLLHENRNSHHWGFWIPRSGREADRPLPMPVVCVREMLADWFAADRSKSGTWDIATWVNANGPRLKLHEQSLEHLSDALIEIGYFLTDNCDWSWMAGERFRNWADE